VTITFKAKGQKVAEILLYGDVGEGWFGGISADAFARELKALGPVETIDLRINSLGGDVFDGMAIYRQLVDHKARVVTHIDGTAASIASVIAMAGSEILISESASIMIHEAWGGVAGFAKDLRALADRMDRTSDQILDVYVARSGGDRARLRQQMAEETWFYGKEAVDAKLATAVVENMRMAAHSSASAWRSQMAGRFVSASRQGQAAGGQHPGNNDIRAEMATLSDRVRSSRAAARSRGAGA
jgi:ATP-dependent Clp protease protease subunit